MGRTRGVAAGDLNLLFAVEGAQTGVGLFLEADQDATAGGEVQLDLFASRRPVPNSRGRLEDLQ